MTALRERAVSHTLDEMLLIPSKEELAVHADSIRQIDACLRWGRSCRNLVDLDRCHLESSGEAYRRDRALAQAAPAQRALTNFIPSAHRRGAGSYGEREKTCLLAQRSCQAKAERMIV